MIHVIGKWYIDADQYQYIAGELYTSPKGETTLVNRTYHREVAGALQGILKAMQRRAMKDHSYTVSQALQELSSVNKAIEDKLEAIKELEVIR